MTVGVIGAGASGIIAALKASEKNQVVLLEMNDKIGKKILVTGNGKCNLWNKRLFNTPLDKLYNCDDYNLLNEIFKYSEETYQYITNNLNIAIRDNDGYIYPYSNTAQSVRELFENKLSNNDNIDVVFNFKVTNIETIDNKVRVSNGSNEYYDFDKVIISVGGLASNLGTDSINLLKDKVVINEPKPSLVPLLALDKFVSSWNGVRTNAKLSLLVNDELIRSEVGELQLTDYGISGIPSFNMSGVVNRLSSFDKVNFEIDFMSEELYTESRLNKLFTKLFDTEETIEEVLETFFNYKLMYVILNYAGIDKSSIASKLYPTEISNLINAIKHFKISYDGTLGFDRAQVMSGGISLSEVYSTMQLINYPNIYVTGEMLDIDGICGGYNLANAFITGYIAGSMLDD